MGTRAKSIPEIPAVIEGDLRIDDRGEVGFVNGFDMASIRRFYTVTNHRSGFVRAWHAHRHESKFVTAMRGSAIVAAVPIDDWTRPSPDTKPYRFILSSKKPSVLYIPKGYANGFMTLCEDTTLVFFSTASLDESRTDDVRYDARYWDPWQVAER